MRTARVTINDLARNLGLAKGTVSRALNGYPDIAETTRKRVARTAERMGYRPLAQAQAIRTGRARALGLVLNAGGDDAHKPFLTDFLDGISRAASEESWSLTVATAEDEADEVTTMARLIEERKVDGFILPRPRLVDARIDLLRGRDVPFVLYGRTANPDGCAWHDIKGEDAMKSAVLRLAGRGHRRIGFINGALDYTYAHLRREGYLAGLAEAGLDVAPELMTGDAITMAQGETQGEVLLDLPDRPSAIVCALDLAALGLYRAAARRGVRIGPDLAVIAYDGIPEAATAHPPLTTYAVDSRAAGARLARLLFARIRGADPTRLREEVPARLIARGSDIASYDSDPAAQPDHAM
ncbi:LacI family transcriptional regulator [Rhodophyticola sp. CCM32]|nr:LacI family transcriptional regulator [Rhodophyticola sp. CCM32]